MVGEREENLKKKHIYTKKTAEAVFFAYCTNAISVYNSPTWCYAYRQT